MDWVTRILAEYKEGRKQARKHYNSLDKDDPEREVVGSMIRDMDFTINWLEMGYIPGKRIKGIQRKDVYRYKEHFSKPFKYSISGYWDDSVNAFASIKSYKDPFEEVEERIDRELEEKRNESS